MLSGSQPELLLADGLAGGVAAAMGDAPAPDLQAEVQAALVSEAGIDAIAKVTLTLANADSYCSQIERGIGWKGSRLTVRFGFFDLTSGATATELATLFQGLANAPEEISESTVRLTFNNRLALQRLFLPEVRIQKRCPWIFPPRPGSN